VPAAGLGTAAAAGGGEGVVLICFHAYMPHQGRLQGVETIKGRGGNFWKAVFYSSFLVFLIAKRKEKGGRGGGFMGRIGDGRWGGSRQANARYLCYLFYAFLVGSLYLYFTPIFSVGSEWEGKAIYKKTLINQSAQPCLCGGSGS
jgi:hypothetical protein